MFNNFSTIETHKNSVSFLELYYFIRNMMLCFAEYGRDKRSEAPERTVLVHRSASDIHAEWQVKRETG